MSPSWQWQLTPEHFWLYWPEPRPCLSSAVLNGGFCQANQLLNLKVSGDAATEPPEQSLQRIADEQGRQGTTVGMMTAAAMTSMRWGSHTLSGQSMAVFVSCGLSNARCAGDPADWVPGEPPPQGTINTLFITEMSLSVATMVEITMLLTEAKAHVLAQAGIVSPLSGALATGTGTDSTAVIGGRGPEQRWFGKHTRPGELAARLMIDCLSRSIHRQP